MFRGVLCPERERLLQAANTAVKAHSSAVLEMSDLRRDPDRKPNVEELFLLKNKVNALSSKAEAAWAEYRKHVQEHGC
jgi:hypothetical protein